MNKFIDEKNILFLFISYVRETMEDTGITRKSVRDLTPKQKRTISPAVTGRSPKMTTIATQHILQVRFLYL